MRWTKVHPVQARLNYPEQAVGNGGGEHQHKVSYAGGEERGHAVVPTTILPAAETTALACGTPRAIRFEVMLQIHAPAAALVLPRPLEDI